MSGIKGVSRLIEGLRLGDGTKINDRWNPGISVSSLVKKDCRL